MGVNIHELCFDQKGTRSTSAVENDLSDKTITDYGITLTMRTFELTRQGEDRDDEAQMTIGKLHLGCCKRRARGVGGRW